jgi:hypothetical protein
MTFRHSLQPTFLLFNAERWIIFLAPVAILAAIALARRTWIWGHTIAFSITYLVSDVAIDYWDVYVLGHMDEKFRHSPIVAFEIGLVGAGVFSAVGAIAFLIGLSLGKRMSYAKPPARRWPVSFASGMLAALGDRILYTLLGKTGHYAPIAWGWIFVFPLACTFLLRPRRPEHNGC